MDQCSSGRVPVLPLSALSSHNSSIRSETERTSVHSTGLEQDNETLRKKLRQTRDENSRLISLNNGLNTELETYRYELHRSAGRIQSFEQSAQQQAAELLTLHNYVESEKSRLEQELSEWKCRANESCEAASRSADTIQQLHNQLEETKKMRAHIEGERNLALDSAERIQKAYEDFQRHVHDRMRLAQQQINTSASDRDKVHAELINCQTEVKNLHEEMLHMKKDGSVERDAREQLEQLNADIRMELSQAGARIAELEAKLTTHESLQHENSNLKLTVEQQRVRLERCQVEVGESRAELGQLEDLAQRLQQNMSAVHTSQKSSQANSISASTTLSVIDDASDSSNFSTTGAPHVRNSALKAKIAVLEAELEQARKELALSKSDLEAQRQEVKRLKQALTAETDQATGAVAEMADIGARTVQELEASLAHLEDDRANLLSTISTLESHIADLEAKKAAGDAELIQRGQQLEASRREMADHGAKEATLSREVRKQTLQIASLERQLDEKVSEIAMQVKRSAKLSDEVQSLSAKLRLAHEERDEQSQTAIENASACSQMRQLHDAQCRQLEATIASLTEQHQVLEAAISQSDARSAELQQNLSEMTEQTNTLRLELSRQEHEQQKMTEILENRATHAEELVSQLESELHYSRTECQQLRTQCNETINELQSSHEQISELNRRLEDLSVVEMQLKKCLQEQKDRASELDKSSEHDRQQLHETEAKLTELECEQVRLLSQIAQSEHALQCKTVEYKSELSVLEKKLSDACSTLDQRDEQVKELNSAFRKAEAEHSQAIDDLGAQLKTTRKQLKQQSKMCDCLQADNSQLKAELDLSAATCDEKNVKIKIISERLMKVEGSLESVSTERTELLSEVERLKLTAKKDLAQKLEEHDREVGVLRGEMDSIRVKTRQCEDALRSKEKEVESLTSSLQDRQWELQQRAAQLTQLDMVMKDQSSDWDQRLIRLETSLKKSRLETEQRLLQVRQLEEQVAQLMSALKEKTTKIHELEQLTGRQTSSLDEQSRQISQLEQSLSEAQRDKESAVSVNREAENQLSASRSHLETLQQELSDVRSRLATTSSEHDRLARDLADAVSLLQAKDTEHAKLVQQLAEAGEERSRLQTSAASVSQATAEHHQTEMGKLHRQVSAARDDACQLQQQLSDAGERQAALVVELRRMAQQLSSGQMELEASRAIASAQRETILVREAEIARLEARLGLVERTLQQSSSSSLRLHRANDNSTQVPGPASSLPDVDHTVARIVNSSDRPVKSGSETVQPIDPAPCTTDAQISVSLNQSTLSAGCEENPDSLLAIWHQLQLNDTSRQSAGDAATTSSLYTSSATTAASRLGGAFEEKARVQDRIKALIGYREPTRKASAAGKPKMSVRPQPPAAANLNHSRSTTGPSAVKLQRRVSASESVNSSQLSTAVSRYASERLPNS